MPVLERIHIPDGYVHPEILHLIDEQMDMVERAINEVTGIVRRRTIPEKPREGQIYYLELDLTGVNANEGYWVFLNDEWYRMELTKGTDLPETGALNAL